MNQKETALNIINKAKATFSGEVEVFISTRSSLEISVLNGGIEALNSHAEIGVGIRALDQGKLGFAYASGKDPASIDQCLNQAIHNAKCTVTNPFLAFSKESLTKNEFDIYDTEISKIPLIQKIELAKTIEAAARKFDKRVIKTEKVTYEELEYEVYLQTSVGFEGGYKGNHCGGFAQVIAGDGNEFEAGTGFLFAKKFKEINPEKIGIEAAQTASELLGAKSTKSRKTTVMFDPRVATQILGIIAAPLSGEAMLKGKSLFADKKNKLVAAKIINIVDDRLLSNGLATSPFDGEGIPAQKTILIKDGMLQNFFHNIYSANKLKVKPTGNGLRGSYHAQPTLSPTNFYIENGTEDPNKLVSNIKDGIYITRIMGAHTANPISGDFSFGAQGIEIKNGKKTFAVRGMTIAGNIINLLKSIAAIGNDLRFTPTLGSPTLVVENIAAGGH